MLNFNSSYATQYTWHNLKILIDRTTVRVHRLRCMCIAQYISILYLPVDALRGRWLHLRLRYCILCHESLRVDIVEIGDEDSRRVGWSVFDIFVDATANVGRHTVASVGLWLTNLLLLLLLLLTMLIHGWRSEILVERRWNLAAVEVHLLETIQQGVVEVFRHFLFAFGALIRLIYVENTSSESIVHGGLFSIEICACKWMNNFTISLFACHWWVEIKIVYHKLEILCVIIVI